VTANARGTPAAGTPAAGTPAAGTPAAGTPAGTPAPVGGWSPVGYDRWRRVRSALPLIYPVQASMADPAPAAAIRAERWAPRPAACVVCRGPVRPRYARCYQCERHGFLAAGLLADVVVPISYAVKGTALAADLWRYKAWPASSACARTSLLALLLAFLHDHGACVWRCAGMPAPGRLAVVPTGSGRPGPHPLTELAAPYLRLPPARLVIRPGGQGRELNVHRFRAGPTTPGASVLLLDDSWVSGASAQSAAAALKLAGAGHVAIVVLGRHLDPADPVAAPLAARLAPGPYDPLECAVHHQR
jgi:hypothetical protein